MAVVTMRQLLESGVHFGHQTRRWNPKMKRFIFTERNGIYIIDLQQSLSFIDRAYEFVKETVAHGGSILFVGTKKQGQEAIAEQATRVGMPYVNQRWQGGMLTNFSTVYKRLQRLKELEEINFEDVASSGMTKKELLSLQREKEKLERTLGGIRDMQRVPSAVWVVDTKKEQIAVGEAKKLGIPVVAILDTNCDPDEVNYPIPGNDDAIRSVNLLTRVIADAVADGLMARAGAAVGTDEKPVGAELGGEEPLAEWERELLAGQAAEAASRSARPATRAATQATASGETASGETASGETASGETASGETASGETASGETAIEAAATGAATDAGTETAPEAGTETAPEAGTESATEVATSAAAETATEAPGDTATEAGTDSADTATEAGTDSADTATEAGSDSADTATEVVAIAETGAEPTGEPGDQS
jgi:small subunit ribosomal protein S2